MQKKQEIISHVIEYNFVSMHEELCVKRFDFLARVL